jgi:hypothetical protein
MANSNTITTEPAFLALRVDALLRLDRFAEAAAAISATEAFNLGHERFIRRLWRRPGSGCSGFG